MKALLIPAVDREPCAVVELNPDDLRAMQALVGGYIEEARYDRDAVCIVNEEGRLLNLARNRRATGYIRTKSDAAREGRMQGAGDYYALYGPVVVLGETDSGRWTDVPERLVEQFGANLNVERPGIEL